MGYVYSERTVEREEKLMVYLCEKRRVDFLMNENRPNPFYQTTRVHLENGSFLSVPDLLANEKSCRNCLLHSVHQTYDMLYDAGYTMDRNANITIADEIITMTYAIVIDDLSYDGIISIDDLNNTMAITIAQNLLDRDNKAQVTGVTFTDDALTITINVTPVIDAFIETIRETKQKVRDDLKTAKIVEAKQKAYEKKAIEECIREDERRRRREREEAECQERLEWEWKHPKTVDLDKLYAELDPAKELEKVCKKIEDFYTRNGYPGRIH